MKLYSSSSKTGMVTRSLTYPYDVILRTNKKQKYWVLISDHLFTPSSQGYRIRTWPYGPDWRIIFIEGKMELIFENHAFNLFGVDCLGSRELFQIIQQEPKRSKRK